MVVVAETELSQLASIRLMELMELMMVVVVVVTGSFISGFSTVAAPLISMLKTSSSTDSSTSANQSAVKW